MKMKMKENKLKRKEKIKMKSTVNDLDSMIVFIQEFKKLSSFVIWCLENHLPAINDVVAFLFSTEIPQRLAWKAEVNFILFSLFINRWVRGLFYFAQTVPELPDSLLKKSQRSCETTIKCSWYKWTDDLNIHLAVWIMSIITMILLTLGTWMG